MVGSLLRRIRQSGLRLSPVGDHILIDNIGRLDDPIIAQISGSKSLLLSVLTGCACRECGERLERPNPRQLPTLCAECWIALPIESDGNGSQRQRFFDRPASEPFSD